MVEWLPWKEFETPPGVVKTDILDIAGPPCRGCVHWRPQRQYLNDKKGPIFDGVKLCHAPDMFGDFSCYVAKPEEQ